MRWSRSIAGQEPVGHDRRRIRIVAHDQERVQPRSPAASMKTAATGPASATGGAQWDGRSARVGMRVDPLIFFVAFFLPVADQTGWEMQLDGSQGCPWPRAIPASWPAKMPHCLWRAHNPGSSRKIGA